MMVSHQLPSCCLPQEGSSLGSSSASSSAQPQNTSTAPIQQRGDSDIKISGDVVASATPTSSSLPRAIGPLQVPDPTPVDDSAKSSSSSSNGTDNSTSSSSGSSSSQSIIGNSSSSSSCTNSSTSLAEAAAGPVVPSPFSTISSSSYEFMLTRLQRERGITYMGSGERLRLALDRAIKSKQQQQHHCNISIAFCDTVCHSRNAIGPAAQTVLQ